MSEWETIVTAPRMKTILLWAVTDLSDDGEVRNWKMETGFLGTYDDEQSEWHWPHRLEEYDVKPTHWMPLPAPPAGGCGRRVGWRIRPDPNVVQVK